MNKKYLKLKTWTDYIYWALSKKYKCSYSQNGEDIIINSAVKMLKMSMPSYLDIGANHPRNGSNTYFFYLKGSHGVLVEPSPSLYKVIQKMRKRDVCLNVGIGPSDEEGALYYMMTSHQLNTFKKEEADAYVAGTMHGSQKIENVISVPLVTINSIIGKHFPHGVDILSLDTEGYDLEILQSLDFKACAPKIICVETLHYDEHGKPYKQQAIADYLTSRGYTLYADTHINSIFVPA